jgi:hypothetical protein
MEDRVMDDDRTATEPDDAQGQRTIEHLLADLRNPAMLAGATLTIAPSAYIELVRISPADEMLAHGVGFLKALQESHRQGRLDTYVWLNVPPSSGSLGRVIRRFPILMVSQWEFSPPASEPVITARYRFATSVVARHVIEVQFTITYVEAVDGSESLGYTVYRIVEEDAPEFEGS